MQTTLLKERLKAHGMSITKPRTRIFEYFLMAERPVTIQELVAENNTIHYATIYRTIHSLMQTGVIQQVPIGFTYTYELSDVFKPHHHHVTCEVCHKSMIVHSRDIENLMHRVTIQAGMQPTRHHFEAYGICQACVSE